VPSIRFRYDELSRQALAERVQREFGTAARIVSASEVRVGGVGGFFARRYIDVVVDVPGTALSPGARDTTRPARGGLNSGGRGAESPQVVGPATVGPTPVGLAALLEEAERAERAGRPPSGSPRIPLVSTQTDDFARLMSELSSYSTLAPHAGLMRGAGAPLLVDGPGSLVLFVGLGDDAMIVARSLARHVNSADVRMGGRILGEALPRVDDRRQAAAFRTHCIQGDAVGLLAWGLGLGAESARTTIPALRALDADQIWVVVDASRKPDDTAAWVNVVRSNVPAEALAVLHSVDTATPETVNALGLPVGWSDSVG
jgi:hypothetical protein